jgi:hypothetical protein
MSEILLGNHFSDDFQKVKVISIMAAIAQEQPSCYSWCLVLASQSIQE